MHEASLHKYNSYLTLTYDDEHLPPGGTLVKSHFTGFMKRLRARVNYNSEEPVEIRFYMCGEYGGRTKRPHYHAILFGYQFPDMRFHQKVRGNNLFSSQLLTDVWTFGKNNTIGEVTFQTAAYVAGYIMKKWNGANAYDLVDQDTGELTLRIPEYTNMSRMPGIGAGWFDKYAADIYPDDFVILKGKKVRTPRFYDRLFGKAMGEAALEEIKQDRRETASLFKQDQTPARLKAREECLQARLTPLLKRDDV